MSMPKDLFNGIRPSDLRYDNPHILAEYIARAQRFAESAAEIEATAERLLHGAMKTTNMAVAQFQNALRHMRREFAALQGVFKDVVDEAGRRLAKAVIDAHLSGAGHIQRAGEEAQQHHLALVQRADSIEKSAHRLEQAAETAAAEKHRTQEELRVLRAFKAELALFERESQARIEAARARLYLGVGWWKRLRYVVDPPKPTVRLANAPCRPSGPMSGPSPRPATKASSGGSK